MSRRSGLRLLPALCFLAAAPQLAAQSDTGVRDPRPSLTSGPRLAPDEAIPGTELEAFLDGLIGQAMIDDHIAGAVVAVVQNGAAVLEKGYGFADLETARRVDPEGTLFRIGSITKTFTWILLMREVEAGRINLDDPINQHLPPDLAVPEQGFREPVRVRDLMTHSPGFEDRVLGSLFVGEPENIRPLVQYLAEDRVARVREPGRVSSYSNYGVGLAGAMLEHLEGRPWQDLVDSEILVPLGLVHTTGREPYPERGDLPRPMSAENAAGVATGYRWTGGDYTPLAFEYITHVAPAGAMSSTAGDMSRYMLMLLNEGTLDGRQVFGAGTAEAFRTPLTSMPAAVGNWNAGFLEQSVADGFRGLGHNGATLQFFSNMVTVPELDLGIFVSTNSAGGARLSNALPGRVIQHFYAPTDRAPPGGSPAIFEHASDYAGSYLATRRRASGLEGFLMRFQSIVAVSVTADGLLVMSLQGLAVRLAPTETPGVFTGIDFPVSIAFEPPEGKAEHIVTVAMGLERAGPLDTMQALLLPGILTVIIAVTVLGSLVLRRGHPPPHSVRQLSASQARAWAALFWLVAAVSFLWLGLRATRNPEIVLYTWPTPSIVVFSSSALLASALSVVCILMLPGVWRSAGRAPQWGAWRKLRYTVSALVFVALALVLGRWGALQPWDY